MKIKQLDKTKLWVTWVPIGYGMLMFICTHPDFQQPLGFVWGVQHGGEKKRFEVMGSYTEIFYRRLGVRTKINEQILKLYDIVTSPSSSKQGKAFMKANGYSYSKELSQWYKLRKSTGKS